MRNETYLAIKVLELMVDLQSRAVEVFGAHLLVGARPFLTTVQQ